MVQAGSTPPPPLATAPSPPTVDAVVELLTSDGYAILPDLLPADDARSIGRELRRLLDGVPTGRNPFEGFHTRRLYALFGKTRVLDDLALHPVVLGAVDALLGPCLLSGPTGIEIGPGEQGQILHRDEAIYPVAYPHPELVVNVMWAFDDFTEANGATRLVPCSHRNALSVADGTTPTVPATMTAGSAMVYVGSIWHGGGANTTQHPRLGVAMEYVAAWLRPQETQLLVVPPEVAKDLAPRLQELLGYSIYPPFVGYVDGRHPRSVFDR
ncbi:MAG: phytanoyl-CoA dioxygenase family protein [Actinobacteria bacterium]|nr:phytanoyl-CoA dioxygenase family protein [Actinomycetota bacterium]